MSLTVKTFNTQTLAIYGDFNTYIAAIGSREVSLIIGIDGPLVADLTIPANVDLYAFANGSKITGAFPLTINRMTADPLHQIFDGPTVTFGAGAVRYRRPEWWGWSTSATGAANATAHAAMMTSIDNADVTYKCIEFTQGTYKVAGDPAISFNKSRIIVKFNGISFDYENGTGTAVLFGTGTVGSSISNCSFIGFARIVRTYSTVGSPAAASVLLGTGALWQNVLNFTVHKIRTEGFAYGHKFFANGGGVSYGWIYDIESNDCLKGVYISDTGVVSPESWTTGLMFVGGRIAFARSSFGSIAGSSNIKIEQGSRVPDGLTFVGLLPENETDRKIYCDGINCRFSYLYLDAGGYNTDFSAYVGYPYAKRLTGATSVAGSAVLTKALHGIDFVINDVVRITAGDSTDIGFYHVVASDANTITLDRALVANSASINFDYFRANIEFGANSVNCQIDNCLNFAYNVSVDRGTNNLLIDPHRGLCVGTIDPQHAMGVNDILIRRRGLLDLQAEFNGTLQVFLSNLASVATNGSLSIAAMAKDTNGTLRNYASIGFVPTASDAGHVTGDVRINTGNAGDIDTRQIVKADGKIGIGTSVPKNKTDIAGGLVVGGNIAGKETAKNNGATIEGNVVIGENCKIVEAGDTANQLSGWRLYGITSNRTYYWKIVFAGANPTVTVYNNSAGADGDRVLIGTRTGDGTVTLTELNSSGIAGSVSVAASGPTDDIDLAANTLTITIDTETAKLVIRDSRYAGSAGLLLDNPVANGIVDISFNNDVQRWNVYGAKGDDSDSFQIYDATNSKEKIVINPNTGDIELNNSKVTISDTTEATALDTGSLQTAGGASVKKNLWVGENVNLATGKGVKVNALQVVGDRKAALTAQLTSITHTAPGTPDYAIANPINTNAYGFTTADEFLTLLSVVANLQTRVAELEARLKATGGHGLIADA